MISGSGKWNTRDHRRAIKMTHYPAWIALIVVIAVFATVNLVGAEARPTLSRLGFPIQWQHGWPLVWCENEHEQAKPPVVTGRGTTLSAAKVDSVAFTVDLAIALVVIAGCVFQFAKIRAKLKLQAVFGLIAIIGAGCLTFRNSDLDGFFVDARTVAIFILPIPIGLACLSVLDLVGWVYGKCWQTGLDP